MLGIIGGTGIYQLDGLEVVEEHQIHTPYGPPSAPVIQGELGGQPVCFLARHGQGHQLLPSEVNYRANIWALKSVGVTRVLAVSAVGSLREEIAPGQMSVPSQYFDFVKGNRERSFFGDGLVAHVSTAEPTCADLTARLSQVAETLDQPLHTGKTYGCVDGPRLGTRAESHFLRGAAGCDLVGMTNVPEVFLAREAQLCYCTLCIATDYDCWLDDPSQHVSVEQVISRYGASLERAKTLVHELISQGDLLHDSCDCRHSLDCAVLTPEAHLDDDKRALLELLKR
ncbi:S-methyl-5'-thioadenosine phosphorylase [Motiliproteus sp.]|uniref:S-methyl-5'-thioadenosine phosphorylase n=1 Tax=Motiliproteus sp. TaxID=1898955 RepID=UPI003BACDA20